MGIEKDVRKLKAEELEKRLAPLTIYDDTGEPSDPTSPSGGGGSSEPPVPEPRENPSGREMGNSDGHRQDIVNDFNEP
ncbi:MAG: hypothetical protein ACREF4_08860 [Gammaproteobacteria bacterium]